jgi:hypothetical protein
MQCTLSEIAAWFDVSDETIERAVIREQKMKFKEYFDKKRRKGHISLRRKQMQVAESGNVSMLIWLGKQYLGQTEKVESKSVSELKRLVIQFDDSTDDEETSF